MHIYIDWGSGAGTANFICWYKLNALSIDKFNDKSNYLLMMNLFAYSLYIVLHTTINGRLTINIYYSFTINLKIYSLCNGKLWGKKVAIIPFDRLTRPKFKFQQKMTYSVIKLTKNVSSDALHVSHNKFSICKFFIRSRNKFIIEIIDWFVFAYSHFMLNSVRSKSLNEKWNQC